MNRPGGADAAEPRRERLCPDSPAGKGGCVADVKIHDGIIKVQDLEVQDPRAAAVLADYPEARWPEVMRRAIKIGLGYLKGGAQE
jgi:hypothetical protein